MYSTERKGEVEWIGGDRGSIGEAQKERW